MRGGGRLVDDVCVLLVGAEEGDAVAGSGDLEHVRKMLFSMGISLKRETAGRMWCWFKRTLIAIGK